MEPTPSQNGSSDFGDKTSLLDAGVMKHMPQFVFKIARRRYDV